MLLPSFSGLGWFNGPPWPTVAAMSLEVGGAALLGRWTVCQALEAGNRIIVSLSSGIATGLGLLGMS